MSKVNFDFVPLHFVVDEIEPNVARHYEEMTEGDDYGPPNIDWDMYIAASRANQCVCVTARDGAQLVGYGVFTVGPNPRYKHILQADSSGIFLEKEYRGTWGPAMLAAIDDYLKGIGVHETNYTLSDARVGKLLEKQGYKQTYKVWSVSYGQ
jgi:GNAT superfamily N-acetyltransferase